MDRIRYVDSHTGGEPTRVVLEGFPDLAHLPLAQRVTELRAKHDRYRSAVATEPRASDVVVGAVLMPPVEAGSVASVIYFNNAGYLGMCGHGTIGVIATLQHLGRIGAGTHRLDTPWARSPARSRDTARSRSRMSCRIDCAKPWTSRSMASGR
jgi:proline racemase